MRSIPTLAAAALLSAVASLAACRSPYLTGPRPQALPEAVAAPAAPAPVAPVPAVPPAPAAAAPRAPDVRVEYYQISDG